MLPNQHTIPGISLGVPWLAFYRRVLHTRTRRSPRHTVILIRILWGLGINLCPQLLALSRQFSEA
jgi:hypothetical protein